MLDIKNALIIVIVLLALLMVVFCVTMFLAFKENTNSKENLHLTECKYSDLAEEIFDLEKRVEKLEPNDEAEPKIVKLPITDDGLKDYIPPNNQKTSNEPIMRKWSVYCLNNDEELPEWYYLRLDDEIIDRTKLFQKYDLNWCVKDDTLTYTTKKGIKNSRKVYGKAENIQSLCDLFLLINSKTKAIEGLTVGTRCLKVYLDWFKNRAKNDDVVLYGGILVADEYYVNLVCEYNPNSDFFYSIER